jgi:hypothetical protein
MKKCPTALNAMKLAFWMALMWALGHANETKGQFYCIPTRFVESPVPPPPDYSKEQFWTALPNRRDRADRTPTGLRDAQDSASVDVFYVHPTLYSTKPRTVYRWNQDLRDHRLNREIDRLPTLYQASAFNGAGKIYAPRYRQAHYSAFLTPNLDDKERSLGIAYSDVEAAFDYFLKNYNQGRPFIVAGHSQGTLHAARLLKHKIIGTPLQQRLVVAYLPGMAIPADSLAGLPVCVDSNSIGCFVSWSTYLRGYMPPTFQKVFAKAVAVNPISWEVATPFPASDTCIAEGSLVPKERHRGAVLRPFGKKYPGICDAQVVGGVVWVTKPRFWGSFLYRSPNYHAGDINLFYLDIRGNAVHRARQFVRQR